MLRSLRRFLCFSSSKSCEATDSTAHGTETAQDLIRLRPAGRTIVQARVPSPCPEKPGSVQPRAPSVSPSSCNSSTQTESTIASDGETRATTVSTVIGNASTSPETPAKTTSTSRLNTIAPYTPILQSDGSLRAPQVTFDGYGSYGGRFAPESIMGFLYELTSFFEATVSDPSFWEEYATFQSSQVTPLHTAENLTRLAGGATIWLKREDKNEYGSHKTRNITGQLLLARRMGRSEIVTDCASAKHGNFTAAICARLGLRCVVVMGSDDASAQEEDVLEMKSLGAKVLTTRTTSGMGSLRAAITEALRYAVRNHQSAYYLMGSPVGPSPLPTLARTFQALMGEEVAAQMHEAVGRQPDALVTAVGSGSGAIGLFRPFLHDSSIRLVGVEAVKAAALTDGGLGVLQGARTLLLQNDDGQILDSHSISPDMNLSTVGPEVAHWKDSGRIEISTATDAVALDGFRTLHHHEGILPGLDSSHAVAKALDLARELGPGKNVVLMVTGCDKIDVRGLDI
ncbi:Tryptophan synthase beta subunit-like PLP-dependent enzymes superfamily [Penicillium cf. griseofulvum]|uniref:tryptophan synthase n=1 Tax=Penicillium cf. griseofulvum TaxID=2972120 RepID=A0A9W9MS01_9EURO|nr:Tryptophan synthase beta subunit-like PLP-dependent enzymes superfamily [Penicillium cf. griseofulvum]KAJ5440563.1 Tryptophan synthase beta subunit-like PLP-dependent enzymes superfamily [Penicillium cf. griseofulvum]